MKRYISLITALLTVGIAGCKKDYLSLENNPNQPSVTVPSLALPSAEKTAAAVYATDYPEYGVWAGYWTTSGNYVPNPAINEYQLTTGSYTGVWTDLYANLANWNNLQQISSDPSNANYRAIAMIMKVYDFQQLVDNFNDVPYSQAFNIKNLTPAYDKGSDIYEDLGKQLDAAITLIGPNGGASAASPAAYDIVFGAYGDNEMVAWAAFANTLKLRLALRVYLKSASDPLVTALAATTSTGYLGGGTGAMANPGYVQTNSTAGFSQESPFYGSFGFDINGNPTGNNNYYRANAYGVAFYKNTNDPRLTAFYAPTTATKQVQGNVFGDILHNAQNPGTSAIGPGLLQSATQDAVLMTASEADFLLAEAIQRGILTPAQAGFASAEAAYNAGIEDSFTSLGLTVAQAQAYYGQSIDNVNFAVSGNKITAILTQKWAALNGWSNFEAYNDYRRTGIPNLPTSVDPAAIGTNLPTRLLYPTSELSTNAGAVAKEGAINPLSSKIFWAK
ncbi:MAG TPA: SusD/RagB family nutrient-binding outer membrane lipoprotein [Mucilaginibacter sp.]